MFLVVVYSPKPLDIATLQVYKSLDVAFHVTTTKSNIVFSLNAFPPILLDLAT